MFQSNNLLLPCAVIWNHDTGEVRNLSHVGEGSGDIVPNTSAFDSVSRAL